MIYKKFCPAVEQYYLNQPYDDSKGIETSKRVTRFFLPILNFDSRKLRYFEKDVLMCLSEMEETIMYLLLRHLRVVVFLELLHAHIPYQQQ